MISKFSAAWSDEALVAGSLRWTAEWERGMSGRFEWERVFCWSALLWQRFLLSAVWGGWAGQLRQVEESERACDCVCFLVECFVISFTE